MLAQGFNLPLEAATQLEHELLVGRLRGADDDRASYPVHRLASHAIGRDRLYKRLGRTRDRSASQRDDIDELLAAMRAHAHGRIAILALDLDGVVDLKEAQYLANHLYVVAPEVVVDQGQHALSAEALLKSPQLLDIANVFGVQQCPSAHRIARNVSAATPLLLEADRPGEVRLVLDLHLQQLQMKRIEEAGGLAEHRDDTRVGAQLGDPAGGRGCPQIRGRGLARTLLSARRLEQRQIGLKRPGAPFRPAATTARSILLVVREELRLLPNRHEYLRMAAQHRMHGSGAALGVADDEEVRQPATRSPRSPKLGERRFAGRFRLVSHRVS